MAKSSNNNGPLLAVLAVGTCLMTSHMANAAEGGVLTYPAGAPGSFVGEFPPIPGLFALSQFSYSSANGLYDNSGKKLPVPFSLSAPVETIRLLASYPIDFFGAHVYSQAVIPAGYVSADIAGASGTSSGVANITLSPVILNWVVGAVHHFTLGLDIALPPPLATYNKTALVNIGSGYASFDPVLAYRYDQPNGPDFGASFRVLLNTNNTSTDYQTGDALIADLYAGWNFGKLKVGAAGGWTNQFQPDVVNGVSIGNKLASLVVGPSVTYDLGMVTVNVNYQQNVYIRNGANTSTFWFNVAAPLYIMPPPAPAVAAKY